MPPPSQGLPPQQLQDPLNSTDGATAPGSIPVEEETRQSSTAIGDGQGGDIDPKTGKRRVLALGKKTVPGDSNNMEASSAAAVTGALPQTHPAELKAHPIPSPISPARLPYSPNMAASPSRLRSSSPRMHSPASSEIFERNVQEPVSISGLQPELDPAHIPTHVMTEDHIPPALEATAQAITSEELNPDEVEIVTSSVHQPAAEKVLEASASHADLTQLHSPSLNYNTSDASEMSSSVPYLPVSTGEEDGASNYGQLDPNDVRRLSFISFADVVQSEHLQQVDSSGFPVGLGGVPERAASPLRSPRSPRGIGGSGGGLTNPSTPGVAVHSLEQSPARSLGAGGGGLAAAVGSLPTSHGELQIETMRQAVRKTASGDLSGVRSAGMSPISDEGFLREPRSRTNT